MTDYLVLEDFTSTIVNLKQGSIITDRQHAISPLINNGAALAVIGGALSREKADAVVARVRRGKSLVVALIDFGVIPGPDEFGWQSQVTWYIDPVSGSDLNKGDTSTAAIKTWAEFRRRVGVGDFEQDVTVTWLNGDSNQQIDGHFILHGGAQLTIIGTPVVDVSGTLTGQTSIDPSTNQPQLIDDAVGDWTNHVGKRVDLAGGSSAWIAKVISATQARVSQFQTFNPAIGGSNTTPAGNETYDVVTLPVVENFSATVSRGSAGVVTKANGLVVQNFHFTGIFNRCTTGDGSSVFVAFYGCVFTGLGVVMTPVMKAENCHFSSASEVIGSNGLISAGLISGFSPGFRSPGMEVSNNLMAQGVSMSVRDVIVCSSVGACIFDAAVGLLIRASGRVILDGGVRLWGSGNTTALSAKAGSRLVYSGTKPNIAGTTEVNLGDGLVTDTWANMPALYLARDVGVLDEQASATVHGTIVP